MGTLPTFEKLGFEQASPVRGSVGYQATSGQEEAPSAGADKFGQLVTSIAVRQQDALDTTRAEDAWNQYKNKALDLAAGKDGFSTKLAGNAINGDLYGTYTGALGDARKQIDEALPNDEVRRKFTERANVTDLQFKDQLLRHYTNERLNYEKQTYDGSMAAATSIISAAPMDQGAFDLALVNAQKRAKALADLQGVTDPDALKNIDGKVKDALLTTRVEALMYSNPVAADALFRLTSDEFHNPEMKLQLQSKVGEASLRVQASNQAGDIMREVRAEQPTARPAPSATPIPVGTTGKASFNTSVDALLKREGGYKAVDGNSGAPVNFGINQAANPDIDVKSLTADQAKQIYKTRYWDAIGGDNLPPATAMVALDTAALQGVGAAQALLRDSGGDPQTMIEMRKDQLAAIAQRDPAQAKYLPQWTARVNALQAQLGIAPPSTNGLPDARDIRAQLPSMLAKVEERANTLYGADQNNPDRAAFIAHTTNELRAKVNLEATQLEGIQKQAQGTLIDYIAGFKGNAPVTSFSQIQANPEMFRAWQLSDPAAKLGLERLVDSNARGDTAGNPQMYWEAFNKIHQEPGTPGKIDFYQQILPFAGPGKLSMPQITMLRNEIDRNETPGGRSVGQLMRTQSATVAQFFKTTPMFTMQPDRQIAATMKWTEDVGKKVDEYAKAGKDARTLFMSDTPDSMVKPQVLQTYVNSTPAQGLADQAAKVKADTEVPPVTLDPKNPNDTFNSLQPGARYKGPDGVVRTKPGSAAQSAAPAQPAQPTPYGTRADGTPKGAGFYGELQRPDGRVSTELSVGVNINNQAREIPLLVPGLTKPEVDQLLNLKEGEPLPQSIVDKAVEHARGRIAAGKDPYAQIGEVGAAKPAATPQMQLPVLEEGSLMERRRVSADERQVQADERERLIKVALSAIPRSAGAAIVTGVQATGEGVRQAVAVPGRIGSAVAQMVPTESERYANAFRSLLSTGRYRLESADTIKSAMQTGLLTPDENAKAIAMMQAIAARARK